MGVVAYQSARIEERLVCWRSDAGQQEYVPLPESPWAVDARSGATSGAQTGLGFASARGSRVSLRRKYSVKRGSLHSVRQRGLCRLFAFRYPLYFLSPSFALSATATACRARCTPSPQSLTTAATRWS